MELERRARHSEFERRHECATGARVGRWCRGAGAGRPVRALLRPSATYRPGASVRPFQTRSNRGRQRPANSSYPNRAVIDSAPAAARHRCNTHHTQWLHKDTARPARPVRNPRHVPSRAAGASRASVSHSALYLCAASVAVERNVAQQRAGSLLCANCACAEKAA